jgi:transcriptional regulator with XRE-family HTH domain
MTAHSIPVVETLIHSFGDWLKHRREMNELRELNTSEFDRIASELRVSPSDLSELVRQGPHAADELPQMLKVLGIDEEALARTQPLVLRDMERVCALCHQKGECVRDFAAGTAAEHYEEYCPNAPTIDVLGLEVHK